MNDMIHNLGLVGDGDDIDVVEVVERAFDIVLKDEDVDQVMNMGDLHDLVAAKLGASDDPRRACLSAVCFYRLRRALRRVSGVEHMTPRTHMTELVKGGRFRPVQKQLEALSGLELPEMEVSGDDHTSVPFVLGSPLLALFTHSIYGWHSLWFLLGWALVWPLNRFFYNRSPLIYPDVGSLAKAVAGLNYQVLQREFGGLHEDDLWRALVVTILDRTDATGTFESVGRETEFIIPSWWDDFFRGIKFR